MTPWQSNWAQRKLHFATGLLWAHKLRSKHYSLHYHKVFCSCSWFLKSRKMPINSVLSRHQNSLHHSFNRPPTSSSIWAMLFAWSFLPSLRKITLNQNNLLLQQDVNCVQAWKEMLLHCETSMMQYLFQIPWRLSSLFQFVILQLRSMGVKSGPVCLPRPTNSKCLTATTRVVMLGQIYH